MDLWEEEVEIGTKAGSMRGFAVAPSDGKLSKMSIWRRSFEPLIKTHASALIGSADLFPLVI